MQVLLARDVAACASWSVDFSGGACVGHSYYGRDDTHYPDLLWCLEDPETRLSVRFTFVLHVQTLTDGRGSLSRILVTLAMNRNPLVDST